MNDLIMLFVCLLVAVCQARPTEGEGYTRNLTEERQDPNAAPTLSRTKREMVGLDDAVCTAARPFALFDRELRCHGERVRHAGCRFYRHLPVVIRSYMNRADDRINAIVCNASRFVDPEEFIAEAQRQDVQGCRAPIERLTQMSKTIGSNVVAIVSNTRMFRSYMSLWNEVLTCHHGFLENAVLNARCNRDVSEVFATMTQLIPSTTDLICRLHTPTSATTAVDFMTAYQPPNNNYTRHMHNYLIYTSYKNSLFRLQAMVGKALDTGLC